jgi:hypothetical protein
MSRWEEDPGESPFTVWELGVTSLDCDELPKDGVEGSGGAGPKRDLPWDKGEMAPLSPRKSPTLFAIFKLYGGTELEGSPLANFDWTTQRGLTACRPEPRGSLSPTGVCGCLGI